MPRPSLKDQRSGEILDAYLTCVAQFGLEGATQERIAAQAGVKRPLLRHYLGNRDQMIAALTAHVIGEFDAITDQLVSYFGQAGTAAQLIEVLFSESAENDPRLMLAFQALVTAVPSYPDMRAPLMESLTRFLDLIEVVLRREAPKASDDQVAAVAQGISSTIGNHAALEPLAPPAGWRSDMARAALLLVASLDHTQ